MADDRQADGSRHGAVSFPVMSPHSLDVPRSPCFAPLLFASVAIFAPGCLAAGLVPRLATDGGYGYVSGYGVRLPGCG